MKKRRYKKKKVEEDTSQVVKVFNEVDIPLSPPVVVSTKSTIYCLFCYKLASIENNGESLSQTEKLATCHRFYKNITNEKFPFNEEIYGTKCGVCDDCYYVVDNHCKLHFEVECLQLRLRWQLYKLFRVMKYAGRVPSRVKVFKESLMTEKTNGDSVSLESVLDFRQKLYDKSSRRLKTKKPRVLLSSSTTPKPKGRSLKEAKNKISQGTQTLVEFSDIACNTSEVGSTEIDNKPSISKQVKRCHDGYQSQLEAEKTAKNQSIDGCPKNNSKICSVCGIRFKRKRNLNLHMKKHLENEKIEKSDNKLALSKCKLCLGGFSDYKKFYSHKYGQLCTEVDGSAPTVIMSEDFDQRNWRFKAECPECGVIFKERSKEELNTVVKFHLEVSEVHARIVDSWIHVCQFCGIRFQYQCHFKTHLALHEKLKNNEITDDVVGEAQGTPKILDVRSLTGRRRVGRPPLNRVKKQETISLNSIGRRPVGRPPLNRFKSQGTISMNSSGRRPVGRPSLNRFNDYATVTKDKKGKKVYAATCQKCGKTLQSWISKQQVQSLLRIHLQSKFHSEDRNLKFCCLICDRKYPGATQLRIHLQSNIHNSKARKSDLAKQILKCGKCPGAFLSQVKLKNHEKDAKKFCRKFGKSGNAASQKQDFNYVCNLCSMYFQEKVHLRNHENLHKVDPSSRKEISNNDEMDTYDDITGADADIEIELNNAEQSYPDIEGMGSQSTNPVFKCIICNDLFSSEEILVEHARTKHWPLETSDTRNDSKPKATKQSCVIEREGGVISIKTNRSSQSKIHKLRQQDSYTSQPDPAFVCIVCKKPYYSLNSLNSHMMVAHDIIIRPVDPPPVNNIPTEQAPNNDNDDDEIEIIENEIEEVVEEEEQEIQISVLRCERTSKDNVDPLEAHVEPEPQSSEEHRHGKKLMEMKCQVCNKTFMGWSKSYLLATLKEHSELHINPSSSPATTPNPAQALQDNSSVPIPLINIDDMADAEGNMNMEDAAEDEDHIQVRKSSHNPSYAFEGECPKCGKLFYGRNSAHTRQYVQRHLRSKLHGGYGNNYKSCDNCGKRFRTRTLLDEHKLTACEASDGVEIVNDNGGDDDDDDLVDGRGPGNRLVLREIFKCCHCSKTFSTQEKLASHEGARQCFNEDDESDHGDDVDDGDAVEIEESNPHEIELSSDSEYSPEYENSVTKRKQLTQVETEIFKCPIENCNTFFTSNEELACHLAIHVDFACVFCDFRTKNPYDLVDHENTLHTSYVSQQNLKCSRCPEVFDLSENSNSHRFHFLHEHLGIGAE